MVKSEPWKHLYDTPLKKVLFAYWFLMQRNSWIKTNT